MAESPFVDTHFHLHDLKRPELRHAGLERDSIHGFLGNVEAPSSYLDLVDAYAAIIAGFTKDEQMKMFSRNAERLFQI